MKNVLIRKGDRDVGPDLSDQLRILGMTVREIETGQEIERLVETVGEAILVADSRRLEGDAAFLAELVALKERFGPALGLLYYADRDDFATRLGAVRSGGEGFFLLPMDAFELAEKIDSLFSEPKAPPYRVLVVDDDPEQVAYNARILSDAGMETTTATDPSSVIPLLIEARPEIILMDMYMPGCSGTELAALVRQNEAFASTPILFLSVERDLDKQITAIRKGCDEFLEKPIRPEHLVASVAVRAERSRTARFFTERDAMTGLLNHTYLVERLGTELLRARRAGSELSFCIVDLDRIGGINATYGHLTGDRVIRSAARLLSERLRRTDIVGRAGGTQFSAILTETDGRTALRLADELREGFGRLKHRGGDTEFSTTFSCGVANYPDFVGATELIDAAGRALGRAKSEGRDRVAMEKPREKHGSRPGR